MSQRPIQYFSREYLQSCKSMTPMQILEYEENFRTLISLQSRESDLSFLDPALLHVFKAKATSRNIDYHAQIEMLMKEWIEKEEN